MDEKLHLVNTEQSETINPNYPLRRGLAIAGIMLAGVGIYEGFKESENFYKNLQTTSYVDSETINPQAGGVIDSALQAVKDMAAKHKIDFAEIKSDQIVYSSQTATNETLNLRHEKEVQPSDSFVVTLSKGFMGYDVSVNPAGLPTINHQR